MGTGIRGIRPLFDKSEVKTLEMGDWDSCGYHRGRRRVASSSRMIFSARGRATLRKSANISIIPARGQIEVALRKVFAQPMSDGAAVRRIKKRVFCTP